MIEELLEAQGIPLPEDDTITDDVDAGSVENLADAMNDEGNITEDGEDLGVDLDLTTTAIEIKPMFDQATPEEKMNFISTLMSL